MHRLRTWTQGHVEVLRAWQRHSARHFTDWPRLTAIYTHLKALPTAQQTQWRRRCKATLWGVALCLAASGVQPVLADTITVDGICTLVDAITSANTDTAVGFCTTGSGADTIVLTVDATLTTINNSTYGDTGLPLIESKITIAGNGHTIMRDPGAAEFRLIANYTTGDLTIQDTTLSGGVAANSSGGGVYSSGQLRIEGCTVTGNAAGGDGGGVYSRTSYGTSYGPLSLVNSTVSGNTASGDGGGVFSRTYGGTVSVVNSTISGNTAGELGGGVFIGTSRYGTVSVVSSTISGNAAGYAGGGVYSFAAGDYVYGAVALHKNLIAGNTATGRGDEVYWFDDFGGSFLVNNANLFGHSGVSTAAALDGFSAGLSDIRATSDGNEPTVLADILDTTLANHGGPTLTHALVTGSPAFNAAGACGLATDQRGVTRPQGIACDIGAFEVMVGGGGGGGSAEICGNCLDDDGDNKIDVADEDCPALPLSSEKGAFGFKADPDEDQIFLTATFPLGPAINPPNEVVVVQFFDTAGQLACVQIPAGTVMRKPPGWKVKTGGTGTTWSFTDAKGGVLGDPTTDKLSVQCNTKKDVCTVKLNVKEANIAGDATARDITTGVIIGNDAWKKTQGWQPKAKGKKLVTP